MNSGRESTLILTGATGFLGGHLLAAFVERGNRVIVLGRSSGDRSLTERITRLLTWFALDARRGQVEALEVDSRMPRLGLERESYDTLCSRAGPIIHCASDTRFSERNRQEVTDTNIHGLRRMLDFAADSRTAFLHYVSTAYVAGRTSGCCPEELPHGADFVNVYEETKARAEHEVADRCGKERLAYTIIRPSIVYGDSRNGRSTRFNALYHPVRSLALIREIYLNDVQHHGGQKSRACGISLLHGDILRLPLRVFVARRGHVNLIPIDYFVSAVRSILEQKESGAVYHLTTDSPTTIDDIASYCESFLKIEGIEIIEGARDGALRTPPETLFQKFIEPYLPYFSDTRSFDRRRTDRVTPGLPPPDFSYDIFARCMAYAMRVNWGSDSEGL